MVSSRMQDSDVRELKKNKTQKLHHIWRRENILPCISLHKNGRHQNNQDYIKQRNVSCKVKIHDIRCEKNLENTNATTIIYEIPHHNDTTGYHILIQLTAILQGRLCIYQNYQKHVWLTSIRPNHQSTTQKLASSIRLSPHKTHTSPMETWKEINTIRSGSIWYSIQHYNKKDSYYLIKALWAHYEAVSEDWEIIFSGVTLKWNYNKRTVDLTMPGYVENYYANSST